MWQRIMVIGLILFGAATTMAQTHQHGAAAAGDGQYNPFIVSDNRGGFYLAYVERAKSVSNVMLRHSSDGVNFSTPVRVNDRAGDATVRNENPPKVAAGARGEVYVCWANERGKWKGDIRFTRSTDGGKTFAPRRLLDPRQKIGKHAHTAGLAGGGIFVAWDDADGKTFSVCGVLDPQRGLLRRSDQREGVAYPVAATNGRIAVIAGMRLAAHEIVTYTETLLGN